ncbi:hypothetical protein WJX73_009204 [Symbiochloris irregularis]|uniref:Uncharacterized protein n=1 Tax=Symbiochloris irregularis TaxID=706552 RepID=A0AAW1NXF7_9CHLO
MLCAEPSQDDWTCAQSCMALSCGLGATWDDASCRREDLIVAADLLADIKNLLASSKLPALQEYPAYLRKIFQRVVALRSGRQCVYNKEDTFVENIREMRHSAWMLSEQYQNPLLSPEARAHLCAEMKAAVALTRAAVAAALQSEEPQYSRATLALLRHHARAYAAFPVQTVFKAQRGQLENMQLSLGQVAQLANLGLDVFAELRQLNAEEPLQLLLQSSSDPMDTRLLAAGSCMARCQTQLCVSEVLSDVQYMRWQAKHRDEQVVQNLYPMLLLLVQACLEPRAPRLPSPHPSETQNHKDQAQDSSPQASVRHTGSSFWCSLRQS